jgi:hypothetical protein
MDELKEKAAPKFAELAKQIEEQTKEQVITNNLLCRLCDSNESIVACKLSQQESDDTKHEAWKHAKINDTRISLVLLVLANIALYLDVIRIDGSALFAGLMSLFN